MGETRNAYRIFMGKPLVQGPFERQKKKWEDNIKVDLNGDILRVWGWGGDWNWLRIVSSAEVCACKHVSYDKIIMIRSESQYNASETNCNIKLITDVEAFQVLIHDDRVYRMYPTGTPASFLHTRASAGVLRSRQILTKPGRLAPSPVLRCPMTQIWCVPLRIIVIWKGELTCNSLLYSSCEMYSSMEYTKLPDVFLANV